MTRERLALVVEYCHPRRTWQRDFQRRRNRENVERQRRYLAEHPEHDFTVGTTAQRSPVH